MSSIDPPIIIIIVITFIVLLQRLNSRHKTRLAENFILALQKSQCALLAAAGSR
jgi:hypothetical protein